MLNKKNKQTGFTMIEVIIVIAVIGILTAMTIPSWQSFSDFINLKDSAKMIETKIKLAKNYSLNSLDDKNYGIRIEADKITIFNAVTSADVEVYNLINGVEIYNIATAGGGADPLCNNGILDAGETNTDCGGGCLPCSSIVFNRLTGTSNSGTFGIRMINRPLQTKIISINAQGQTGTDTFGTSTDSGIFEDITNSQNARHIHFNLSGGWTIQSKPPVTNLIFRKNDGNPGTLIEDIDTALFFNAGIFDWQDTIEIDGADQELRIHTLNASGTILCIIRDRTQNDKSIKIYFKYSGIEKEVVSYVESTDGSGIVTVTFGFGVTADPQ